MDTDISGTGVALVTPFDADGNVDYAALEKLIKHVLKGGVKVLVVHGTTGEPPTTSKKEKIEILEFVKKINAGKAKIIIGAGSYNTQEVIDTINGYDLTGVSAIMTVGPYYNKPSQEGFFNHFTAIADASPLPILMYNVPGRTGSNINAATVVRLAQHSNIIGVKEASGNFEQIIEIIKNKPTDFQLIVGDDLLIVPLISTGAVGAITVLANAFPDLVTQMVESALEGEFVKANQNLHMLSDINPLMYEEGSPVGIKKTLEIIGICNSTVRMPLSPASDELTFKIKAELDKISVK